MSTLSSAAEVGVASIVGGMVGSAAVGWGEAGSWAESASTGGIGEVGRLGGLPRIGHRRSAFACSIALFLRSQELSFAKWFPPQLAQWDSALPWGQAAPLGAEQPIMWHSCCDVRWFFAQNLHRGALGVGHFSWI
jgi:hypothetical protein